MYIPGEWLPSWLVLILAAFSLGIVVVAVRSAQWRMLSGQPERVHLVAGGAVCCLVLWLLDIRFEGGVGIHLLGVTTLTLLAGWSFTVLVGIAVVAGFALACDLVLPGLPATYILSIVIPATVTRTVLALLRRPGLGNPFTYILGAGFLGGGIAALAIALTGIALLLVAGVVDPVTTALEYWPLIFLMMFSEGFINGMCAAALAVFYPQWMKTYDEQFFLGEKR